MAKIYDIIYTIYGRNHTVSQEAATSKEAKAVFTKRMKDEGIQYAFVSIYLQREATPAPVKEDEAPVRKVAELSPEEQMAALERLINNPYISEEEREKLLQQRKQIEVEYSTSIFLSESIAEGKPFLIKPYMQPERQIPGGRNALRIESFTPVDRCLLAPLNEKGKWYRLHRPYHLHTLLWDEFDCCIGTECKSCYRTRK